MASRRILLGIAAAVAAAALISIAINMDAPDTQDGAPVLDTGLSDAPPAPERVISLLLDNGYPPLGDDDAPITLVEFGDYQCHFCNAFFHDTEESVIANYVDTGLVRMVFRDFTIIGPDSITAAHGARCAEEQGLFWEYHDAVYSNWDGENTGWASLENLGSYASAAGLDVARWSSCMDAGRYYDIVSASSQDARSLGLGGTPAFFVIAPNGAVLNIQGAQPYEVFERVFDEMLGT